MEIKKHPERTHLRKRHKIFGTSTPLVSVITPTSGRPGMLERCVTQFLAQDYPRKEMIIVHDETWNLIRGNSKNAYPMQLASKTIGAKRNFACEQATGSIICHFDDDDYYAPDWLTHSVAHLTQTNADTTGIQKAYFFAAPRSLYEYNYLGTQPYVIGASLCYYKSVWERNFFRDITEGEDALFCANAGRINPHNYSTGFMAMLHGRNTASHKNLHNKAFKAVDVEMAREILGERCGEFCGKGG